ncbi:hypothetical protein [Rhodococcus sp. UNC363MFTsu5.1]|uniref:hypothetical protein n=1 Tax=Rhodococcus sp. UNC363MFTsu5.1 TaxID=1449069 RepID=UPI0004854C80|nr:hypothetical protein [Rhodococcus sp. UNC363MFTsu5.1]
MRSRLAAVAVTVLASAALTAAPASAQPSAAPGSIEAAPVEFENLCTPTDSALEELSGLAATDDGIYAAADSGTDDSVRVLDDQCRVIGTLPLPVDPFDVEDLAQADGRLWLSDTGDNAGARATVALTDMDTATGAGTLRRLTYPDGAHDAEAILLGRDGVPVLVTKELFGASGIYRPAGALRAEQLPSPGPTALERLGQIAFEPTETPGGPVPFAGSTMITGGAVSEDGTVVALRTYTDVYLYPVPDGDIVAALTGAEPIRVPMPDQPQGEAIAFTPAGDLLSASEANGGPLPPIRVLYGATGLVTPTDGEVGIALQVDRGALIAAGVGAGLVVGVGGALWWWARSRRRRN